MIKIISSDGKTLTVKDDQILLESTCSIDHSFIYTVELTGFKYTDRMYSPFKRWIIDKIMGWATK